MAKLYITEMNYVPLTTNGPLQIALLQGSTDQTPVAISGAAASSAAFATATKFVRVHTDAICSILYAPAGVGNATTNNARMPADATEYFGVNPGDKISVIANT